MRMGTGAILAVLAFDLAVIVAGWRRFGRRR